MRPFLTSALLLAFGLGIASPALGQEPVEPEPPAEPGEQPPAEPTEPAPGQRRPRLGDPQPGDRAPAPAGDGEEALARRRPVLTGTFNPLRSISLEGDLGFAGGGIAGEAHEGTGLDYDKLWQGASCAGFRLQVPMRFFTSGTVSLWAGPLIEAAAGGMEGDTTPVPGSTDVVHAQDLDLSRVVFGGFFRIEIGRAFMEGWLGLGGGHTGRADAILDQTPSGGALTPFVLYERTTTGAIAGGFRGGWVFPVGQRLTFSFWLTVGGWAMGAPDAAPNVPLAGAVSPDGLSGGFVGLGFTVGFGLGDWPAQAREPAESPRRTLG